MNVVLHATRVACIDLALEVKRVAFGENSGNVEKESGLLNIEREMRKD